MKDERIHLPNCAHCDQPIPFGWHCPECVKNERLCQMCGNSLEGLKNSATTCCNSCSSARTRATKKLREMSQSDDIRRLESMIMALANNQAQTNQAIVELAKRQEQTSEQLENLSFFFKELGVTIANSGRQSSISTSQIPPQTIKPLGGVKTDDLGDNLVIKEAVSDENPTFNMILSAYLIQGGKGKLAPEIYEYGIQKGRIKPPPKPKKPKADKPKTPDIKAIQGSNTAFDVPDFDDLPLDF